MMYRDRIPARDWALLGLIYVWIIAAWVIFYAATDYARGVEGLWP